ncbi:hypothetical protein MalM25_20480 [Planctomycetes bacterium MalM25]|nr:hypothetical protein MalM25_20480 [Planctomycetes bacterium MalM25]
MNRAGAAIGVWLLTACSLLGADWRDHLPADWLLVAEAPSLAALDELAPQLFEPWGRPAPPLRATLATLAPRGAFAERSWAIVVASGEAGEPTVAAFAPTDDFDALCTALDADRADDLAIASLFGFDLAIEPLNGWARFSLLDSPPEYGPAETPSPRAGEATDTLRVTLSADGCLRFAAYLEELRRGQVTDRRRRHGPLRWPSDFKAAVDRLAPYAPVASAVAGWGEPIMLVASHRDDAVEIELTTPLATEIQRPPAPSRALDPTDAILTLNAPGALPAPLIDLVLALMQSRPGQIEAPEHPQPQWDDFADACRELLSGCQSSQAVLHLPAAGEPAAANETAAFTWDDSAGPLGDRLRLGVDRWNTMIDAAQARTPLKIELTPVESTGGYRLRSDLIESTGLEASPEIEAIFNRYYGDGRWATAELTPLGQNGWIAAMRPNGAARLASSPNASTADETLLHGELWLDRLITWRQQLDSLLNTGSANHRVRPPMHQTPPIGFSLLGGERLRLKVVAQLATYETLIEHYRTEPRRRVSE